MNYDPLHVARFRLYVPVDTFYDATCPVENPKWKNLPFFAPLFDVFLKFVFRFFVVSFVLCPSPHPLFHKMKTWSTWGMTSSTRTWWWAMCVCVDTFLKCNPQNDPNWPFDPDLGTESFRPFFVLMLLMLFFVLYVLLCRFSHEIFKTHRKDL